MLARLAPQQGSGRASSDITCRHPTSIEAARALSHVAVADGGLVAITLLVTYTPLYSAQSSAACRSARKYRIKMFCGAKRQHRKWNTLVVIVINWFYDICAMPFHIHHSEKLAEQKLMSL
jgi:hypothetical protein